MSYSQNFTRTIEVYYSGSKTVSYPASQNGGSITVNYSGTAREDVTVAVHVATEPFDASVEDCNEQVNGLTASVATMNAAQCLAIKENSEKVSKTIIDGFFHTVRNDLSTQRVELQQAVEARLVLLKQQAQTLLEKKRTMEADYARTTARYQKIFEDLNKELSTRIHELDQPVFSVVGEVEKQSDRMLHTDLVQSAVTFGKESGLLQAQVNVAAVKNHARQAMGQIQDFIVSKLKSERTLHETQVDGNGTDDYYVPICYVRTLTNHQTNDRDCIIPEEYHEQMQPLTGQLVDLLDDVDFGSPTREERQQIESFLQNEIATNITGADEHSNRVRNLINQMFND